MVISFHKTEAQTDVQESLKSECSTLKKNKLYYMNFKLKNASC